MPFYNNFKFGNEPKLLVINPYNETNNEQSVFPPPGDEFFLELAGPPILLLDGSFWLLLA